MRTGRFEEDDWNFLLGEFEKVVGADEVAKFKKSDLAKFVASIAYVAGSEDADRYSLSNLLILFADIKSTVYDYKASDNERLSKRFETLNYGKKSNKKILDFAYRAMAITSINAHMQTAADDIKNNVYNPINYQVYGKDPSSFVSKLSKKNEKFYSIYRNAAPTVASQPVDWI